MKPVLSVEQIEDNVYLCRWHKSGGFGDPYIGICVVHIVDGRHYIHGLLVKEWIFTREWMRQIKDRFNTSTLFFERVKNNKFIIRKL